jgi:hypothetical protein
VDSFVDSTTPNIRNGFGGSCCGGNAMSVATVCSVIGKMMVE